MQNTKNPKYTVGEILVRLTDLYKTKVACARDLAEKSGRPCNQDYFYKWKNRDNRVHPEFIVTIAEIFYEHKIKIDCRDILLANQLGQSDE